MPLPIVEWRDSLDEIERALETTVTEHEAHDRHYGSCAASVDSESHPTVTLLRFEERLGDWDARLHAAAALVGSIRRELDAREVELRRWREQFATWRTLVEQR